MAIELPSPFLGTYLDSLNPADPLWTPTTAGVLAVFDDKAPKDNPHTTDPVADKAWLTGFITGIAVVEVLRAQLVTWVEDQEVAHG